MRGSSASPAARLASEAVALPRAGLGWLEPGPIGEVDDPEALSRASRQGIAGAREIAAAAAEAVPD
jgi:hypothetical protein